MFWIYNKRRQNHCIVLFVLRQASVEQLWKLGIVVVYAFAVAQFCGVAWFTPVKIVLPIQIDQLLLVALANFGLTN